MPNNWRNIDENELAALQQKLQRAKRSSTPAARAPERRAETRQPARITRESLDDELSETNLSKLITGDAENARRLFIIRLQAGGIPIDYKVKSGEIRRRYITFCKAGTPDKFLLPGVPLFLEIKKKGKIAKDNQLEVHEEIKAGGALVFIVDSFTEYETVLRCLADQGETVGKIRQLIISLQSAIDEKLQQNKVKRKLKNESKK